MKNKKPSLVRQYSAGGVVFKKTSKGHQFLIGKHSGYHKWVLPKGIIEEGEKGSQAAIRETEEEVAVKTQLVLPKPIHKEQYFFWDNYSKDKEKGKVFKTVSFYLLEYLSGDCQNYSDEMEAAGWLSFSKALAKLAFKGEKEALRKANQALARGEVQPRLV